MKLLLFFFIANGTAIADYGAGKAAATLGMTSTTSSLSNNNALKEGGVPISENPSETSLYNKDALQRASDREKSSNENLRQINESQRDRLDYTFDLTADLDSTLSKAQEGVDVEEQGTTETFTKTCRRSGVSYKQTCKRERIVRLQVIAEIGHIIPRSCPGHRESRARGTKHVLRHCGGCQGGNYVIDQHKQVHVLHDKWEGCEVEESMRDSGLAELESLTPGPVENPRFFGTEPVSGDIWEETRVYKVGSAVFDQCRSFAALGCVDKGGRCIKPKDLEDGRTICLEYEHRFDCPSGKTKIRKPKSLNIPTSEVPSYEGNKNMVEALSRIEALKQASKSMEISGSSVVSIFKGHDRKCTTNFGGAFKDCCKSAGGIGVKMHLATACSADEKELADWKTQGRCVFVGSRQTNGAFNMNISKDYVYCCFPNKIAKAIQQGARAQLGLDFGTAEHPQCRGLTPTELQRIDFSRIDLSEVFVEIAGSAQKTAETLKRDYAQKKLALEAPSEKETRKQMQEKALGTTERGEGL